MCSIAMIAYGAIMADPPVTKGFTPKQRALFIHAVLLVHRLGNIEFELFSNRIITMSNKEANEKSEKRLSTDVSKTKDKAETKARGDVSTSVEDYTKSSVKQQRRLMQQRREGNPTGTTHDFGTPEIPGHIKARPAKGTELTHKLEQLPKQHTHEKRIPKDGETIPLKQLLSDYRTPFIDAYEHSKQLKDGEVGKSRTLELIVDRMKSCPWSDKIHVKFDSNADNPDYTNFNSTITIRPQEPDWKQIDTFAHEGYHATHQTLEELYLGSKPVLLPDYLRIKGDAEVNSFETEVHVHKELGSPGIVSYEWNDSSKHKQPTKNLISLYNEHGREGLARFILWDAFTDMKINGQIQSSNYHHYHESTYGDYVKGHSTAQNSLKHWFKSDPSAEKRIKDGHY